MTRFWADDVKASNADGDKPETNGTWDFGLPLTRWAFLAVDVYGADDKLVVRIVAPALEQEDFQIEMSAPEMLSVLGRKRCDPERANSNYALL